VEFCLSANVGEIPRPLARVASGGELSRLMLALRTVCPGTGGESSVGAATLVFDEIDVGIGGKTAEAVGRRLKALAAHKQILCVTHQAQIARFADHHYAVSKRVEGERTLTSVRELDGAERVGELARMIGGAEEVETARETARWMIEDSVEAPAARRGKSRAGKANSERKASRRA
jgi:DNA repair protein RecN (Recombination protein N)